nr:unnamed protein product [Callosobruchus analis]
MPNVKEGNVYLKKYFEEDIQNTLKEIATGVPVREAAKKYKIPRVTLLFRRSSKFKKKTSLRPAPYLPSEEELLFADWIIHCCKKCFPRRKEDIQLSVKSLLDRTPRNTPFRNTVQIIFEDPSRVFNADETCFNLCPKTSTVLAPRDAKNVYGIEHASSKQNTTVLFTFSANGVVTPPLALFPGKRLKSEVYESVPKEWEKAKEYQTIVLCDHRNSLKARKKSRRDEKIKKELEKEERERKRRQKREEELEK